MSQRLTVEWTDMEDRGPWTKHSRTVEFESSHLRVLRDRVTFPNEQVGDYDWMQSKDQVRVAVLAADGILFVEQYHYLIGRCLQLPGGDVEAGETTLDAAQREVHQETGFRDGVWTSLGAVHPLPSISPVRIHLWTLDQAAPGPTSPDPTERDLRVVRLPLAAAAAEALHGRLTCAASAAIVLRLAAER